MYTKTNSGKTTADVFFRDDTCKPEKGCEAWINKDGSIHCITLNGKHYTADELKKIGVSVVDIQQTITHYFGS